MPARKRAAGRVRERDPALAGHGRELGDAQLERRCPPHGARVRERGHEPRRAGADTTRREEPGERLQRIPALHGGRAPEGRVEVRGVGGADQRQRAERGSEQHPQPLLVVGHAQLGVRAGAVEAGLQLGQPRQPRRALLCDRACLRGELCLVRPARVDRHGARDAEERQVDEPVAQIVGHVCRRQRVDRPPQRLLGGVRARLHVLRVGRRRHLAGGRRQVARIDAACCEGQRAERPQQLEELVEREVGARQRRRPLAEQADVRPGGHGGRRRAQDLVLEQRAQVVAEVEGVHVRARQEAQAQVGAGEQDGALAVVELGAEAHVAQVAEHLRQPLVERRLGRPARLPRAGGGRRGRPAQQHGQPVGELRAGARRLGDLQLGRLDLAVGDGVDGRGGARRVAAHELEDALRGERVGERVDDLVEAAELALEVAPRPGRDAGRQAEGDPGERQRPRPEALHELQPVGDTSFGEPLHLGQAGRLRPAVALAQRGERAKQRGARDLHLDRRVVAARTRSSAS